MPLGKRLFSLCECQVRLNKQAEWVESSIEPLDGSDNDSFLGIGLWRSSDPLLSPPVAAQLLVFTMIRGCWFSRLPQNWGVRGEERASLKCLIALYAYQESSIFFAKGYPDCYKPLVNFQNSEKIDFDHFVTTSLPLWKRGFSESLLCQSFSCQ